MRKLSIIEKEIEQCQAQIAATYTNDNYSTEDAKITREGFQTQLQKLTAERKKTQSMINMEVINPRLVRG